MGPQANIPPIPTLYTVINLTYQGVTLQLTAHDIMKFMMEQQELLLAIPAHQDALPANGAATPKDWLSLNPKLKHLNLAGHRISISEEQYTTFESKTQPEPAEKDIESKVIDHLENLIRMLYLEEQKHLSDLLVPYVTPALINKNLFDFWKKLIHQKDSTAANNSLLEKTNYPAFSEIINDAQLKQKNTTQNLLEELSVAILSKEFIKDLLSNFEQSTQALLEKVAERFAGDKALEDFFKKINKGVIDFINQKEVKDFLEKSKESSFDFNLQLSKTILFLEGKLKKHTKQPEELNFNLSLKKIIDILRNVLNVSLLEHLGDKALVEEMRKILTNPQNTNYHFLPTLVATLFFSETMRRNFQDIFFCSLALLDLIEAKALLPNSQVPYTLENSFNNIAPTRDFVTLYRERPEDFIAKTIGNHPGAHKYSYQEAMKKRAPLFSSRLAWINAEQALDRANADEALAADRVEKAKHSPQTKHPDNLKISESKLNTAKTKVKTAQGNLNKAKKLYQENWAKFATHLELDLVEQKIAHLMLHWLYFQLEDLNPQPLQIFADQFIAPTPSQTLLITELLTDKILPLIKNRLQHFDCMLPEHLNEISTHTLAMTEEILAPLFTDILSTTEKNAAGAVPTDNDYTDEEDNESTVDLWDTEEVYPEKTDPEEAVKEESLPSPNRSLPSSPILDSLHLNKQKTATELPLARNFIAKEIQATVDHHAEQQSTNENRYTMKN